MLALICMQILYSTHLSAAVLAGAERLDVEMDAHVLTEVAAVGERLHAVRALVRLRLAHVRLRVRLQLRLRVERLQHTTTSR